MDQLDAAKLQDAMDWATAHDTAATVVIRHGCLVGQSRLDAVTSSVPLDGWSMTKSVTSLLVGRAISLGYLTLDTPIGRFFPTADPAHRALTVRRLLTMTSGLHRNWVRELSPQPDAVADALSLPFDHDPGTHWEYAQTAVTLLAETVSRAVHRDIQDFAQQQLFGPLGIEPGTWSWERDRAGHTDGWAHLHMRVGGWARLGQFVLDRGRWHGRKLIATRYMRAALAPTPTNHAYGFLFWLNSGDTYTLPAVYGQDDGAGPVMPAGPDDMEMFVGMQEQRVYVIPSRDMVIVRLGLPASRELDTRVTVFQGRAGEMDHEILRRVLRAVQDVPYSDPGPYQGSDLVLPPADTGIVGDATKTDDVLAGLGAGASAPKGCTPVGCS